MKIVKFEPPIKDDFFSTVKKRANSYFNEKKLSKHANGAMISKTIIMFSIYFIPYGILLSGTLTSAWQVILMFSIMGVGTAGIGLAVMHDAVHGAYSKSPAINKFLSMSMHIIGGSALNWKIQHNVLHHTYTNINGHDDDISPKYILRFSPHTELHGFHKYQYIYAWFLYGLTTLSWVIAKDIKQIYQFAERGLLKMQGITRGKAMTNLVISKVFYVLYMIVIPLIFVGFAWGVIIGGFILMHVIAGFIMGLIFQPAHLTEHVLFPLPSDDGYIHKEWAEHQMFTTANYANRNPLVTWFAGGLNFQIEHHLFPNVCHVHYKRLSRIVKETAKEYGLPYYEQPTFSSALMSHARMLKKFGNPIESAA